MVAGLSVDVGEVVIAGTTNLKGSVLMTVADPRRLRVRADIDETDVPLVRPGQPAKVFLQADERNPVAGTVDRVAPKGTKKDEVVSFETLISVAEDQPVLRQGMSSTVEVEVRRADKAVSVPVQAVVHRRRKDLPDTAEVRAWSERNAHSPGEKAAEAELRYIKIVFVVESGVARARPVETGLSDERRIEILSGVGPNDRVVVGAVPGAGRAEGREPGGAGEGADGGGAEVKSSSRFAVRRVRPSIARPRDRGGRGRRRGSRPGRSASGNTHCNYI